MNQRNNQGLLFSSNLYKNQPNCIIFLGEEGFQLLYNTDILLNNALFEVSLKIIRIYGKFHFALVLENENKKPIKIFSKPFNIEESLKEEQIFFNENQIKKATRQETLENQTIRIKGFYIYPLTKEIAFCIQKIKIQKKPFLLF